MAIDHILALLVSEKDKLTKAIEALQGPAVSTSFEQELAPVPKPPAKRKLSAAGRRAIIAATKAR